MTEQVPQAAIYGAAAVIAARLRERHDQIVEGRMGDVQTKSPNQIAEEALAASYRPIRDKVLSEVREALRDERFIQPAAHEVRQQEPALTTYGAVKVALANVADNLATLHHQDPVEEKEFKEPDEDLYRELPNNGNDPDQSPDAPRCGGSALDASPFAEASDERAACATCGGSERLTERRRAPVSEEWFEADIGPCPDCNPSTEEASGDGEERVERDDAVTEAEVRIETEGWLLSLQGARLVFDEKPTTGTTSEASGDLRRALRGAVDAGRTLASYTRGFSESRTVAEAKEAIERAASVLEPASQEPSTEEGR